MCKKKRLFSTIKDNKKICLECNKWLDLSLFNLNKRSKNGYQPYCRKCQAKKSLAWRTKNPERNKEQKRLYHERNPERWKKWYWDNRDWFLPIRRKWWENNKDRVKLYNARIEPRYRLKHGGIDDGTVTLEFLNEIYNTEHCYYCRKYTEEKNRTQDHKTPLVRGGNQSVDNICMACWDCNREKNRMTEEEFRRLKGY